MFENVWTNSLLQKINVRKTVLLQIQNVWSKVLLQHQNVSITVFFFLRTQCFHRKFDFEARLCSKILVSKQPFKQNTLMSKQNFTSSILVLKQDFSLSIWMKQDFACTFWLQSYISVIHFGFISRHCLEKQ